MKVSYLLLEAVCLANEEAPCKCDGNLSVRCLKDGSPCENLGLKKARATIAVTDAEGDIVCTDEYFGGFTLSADDYLMQESAWIKDHIDVIQKLEKKGR